MTTENTKAEQSEAQRGEAPNERLVITRREYFRGCCTFGTFIDSLISSARRAKFPLLLINRLKARRHWRQGMTGHEALMTQRGEQMQEIYLIKDEAL